MDRRMARTCVAIRKATGPKGRIAARKKSQGTSAGKRSAGRANKLESNRPEGTDCGTQETWEHEHGPPNGEDMRCNSGCRGKPLPGGRPRGQRPQGPGR